ncbi:hypothetical protein WG8_1767 [Paenibacillus sp. Aloe-11]|nr:hypothetical protein WG8_1767 [Paenibacillus sp. Aloe-11]
MSQDRDNLEFQNVTRDELIIPDSGVCKIIVTC